LSGGEQQQVLIARALAQGADILLFDEPTNNLDLKHQLQIMRLIRSLAREKAITSILAIHDLNFAATFSDRVVVLHNGRVFANGKPSEVFTKEIVREAFDVEVKIYDHHGVPHVAVVERNG
jgi:iron complex transport system ATP-binding protein